MDLQSLLHNRTALVVAGVGGAAGVAVYLYRRKTGAAGSSSSTTPTAAAAGTTAAGFDSTATDVAAQLGQAQNAWANTFLQFQTDVNAKIAGLPTSGAPTTTTTTTAPDTSSGALTVTVPANTNLYAWSQQIEAQQNIHTPVINQLEAAGGVQWGAPSVYGTDPSQGNVPIFSTPRTVTLTR